MKKLHGNPTSIPLHVAALVVVLLLLPFVAVRAQNLAPELINAGPLLAGRGETRLVSRGDLLVQDPDSSAVANYQIVSPPQVGSLLLDGVALGAGAGFDQDAIDNSRVSYFAPLTPARLDDAFEFIADDGEGGELGSIAAPLRLPIRIANQPPTLAATVFTTLEDQPLLADLGALDADGDALNCELSSPPGKGRVVLASAAPCTFTYTPNPDATGVDLFYFRVSDTFQALADDFRARITITPVNDPPTALPTPLRVKLNTAQDGTLLGSDVDGDPLRFAIQGVPALGSVEIVNASSGRFRYTPRNGVSGTDSFSFSVIEAQVADSVAATAAVTVSIAASPNRAPIAEPGFVAALEDEIHTGRLLATDADGDTLTFELDAARMAQQGAVQITDETSGAFTYTPDLNATGADLFYFHVGDGSVLSEPVRVDVDIRAVNDAPLIDGEPPATLNSGQTLDFRPAISDVDGDPLQITFSGCPGWANCDAATGHIGGQPAADGSDAGAGLPVTIEVSDGRLSAALGPFTIDVLGVVPVSRATPPDGAYNAPQFVQLQCRLPAAAVGCETFFATDPGAGLSEFVRYDGTPIAIAATATLRYFSQHSTSTEEIQVAEYVIDQTPPALSIDAPIAARLDTFPNVSGTASDADTGIGPISLEITDGTHYVTRTGNGLEVTPVSSSIRIPVQASGEWQLALPQRDWPPGQWSVTAEVADGAGNRMSRTVLFDFVDETASAFTRLVAAASSPTVLPGGELGIRGRLSRLPETGVSMADRALSVSVRGPDGSILLTRDVRTDDDRGHFAVTLDGLLSVPGRHEVQVDFAGTARLDPSSARLAVLVGESAGYAIVVHGRDADAEGLLSHNLTTQRVYDILKSRGFEDDNIRYLSHVPDSEGFDGTPSSALLMESITQWARARLNGAPAPLFFVFVGHAEPGRLLIDGADAVDRSDLASWLQQLEGGLSDDALRAPRIMVLGSCYSESFIAELSAPGRVLISSAGSNEESYRGPLEDFDTASGEAIRSGELFVELLFKRLALDQALPQAYEQARSLVEIFTQRGGFANSTRYFDNAAQHPFFDDNADRAGTNRLSAGSGDGVASAEVHLGIASTASAGGAVNEDEQARFVQVTETLRLGEGRDQADLFAVANNPGRVAAAWAEIRSPSVILRGQGGTIQLDNVLNKVLLLPENGRFQARCTLTGENARQQACFSAPGRYEVFYFARDALTDAVSSLRRSLVYVDRPGNRPPERFALLRPVDGASEATAVVLDWSDALDMDGDDAILYTVELAADATFEHVQLRRDALDSSALALGAEAGLIPGLRYSWRVRAVDRFGAARVSDAASFTVSDDGERGVLRGVVYAQSSSRPIAGARVTVGGESTETGADGRFLLALPPGPVALLVEALGFNPATVAGTTVAAGAEQALAVPLETNDLSVVSLDLETDEDSDVAGRLQGASAGASITFELTSVPQHGVLSGPLNPVTGTFVYRPDPNFNGTDQFRFQVRDDGGRRSSAGTVTVAVRPRNDAPRLLSTSPVPALPRVTLGAGDPTGVRISTLLAGRIEDVDGGDARGIAITWRDNSLGNWQYSLDGGVQWHSVALSSPASATLLGAGPATRLRFLPVAAGVAQLEFRAWDHSAGAVAQSGVDTRSNGGGSAFSTELARTAVTVDAGASFPQALAGTFSVPRGGAHFGVLSASGTAGDANRRFRIVSFPRKGRLRLLNAISGQFRYTADADSAGSDSFGFAVYGEAWQSNTAPVNVEIAPVNRAPEIADSNVSTRFDRSLDIRIAAGDADGDALSYQLTPTVFAELQCGTLTPAPPGPLPEPPILTYTPNVAGTCAETPILITVSDGAQEATASLRIAVTDLPNQPPVANPASFTTNEDQLFRNALSGSDAEGDPIVFEIVSAAARGRVTLLHPVTGRFSYTPNRDANGQDSFEFRVRDAGGASAPATVLVDISPSDDAPRIAGTPPPTVAAGNAYAFTPDAFDPDGEALVFSFENCPPWATCNPANGGISGVPDSAQVGVARNVRIFASDGSSVTALPGFDIAVLPDSGAPEIVRSTADGAYDDAQQIALTCHDSAGGSCEIFYTLDDPAVPPVFDASSALRAGAGLQIRGEVVGASTGVSTSGSYALSHVVGQPGIVGSARSRHYRASAGAVSADSDGDGTPDIHDLFPTDPSAYVHYKAPIDVDESATLRFFSRDEAGNTGAVSSARYTIDREAPHITITAPGLAAITERILWIGGTVADAGGTGVAELTVEIKDENQYLTPSGTSGAPTRLPVDIGDGGAWLLFTGTVPWQLDTVYSITARARDLAGNEGLVSRLVQLSDSPVQRPTRLSLELSARRVLVDDRFALAGKLTRLPDSGLSLAGRPITITVFEPDGSERFTVTTHTRDDLGNYRLRDLGGFASVGPHEVVARFADTELLAASEARATVQVASAPGLAILIQGKRAADEPDPAHALALQRLRTVLLSRGIGDADINYLGYGSADEIDDQPSRASVENAISRWARGRLLATPAPLLIALVGYGEPERFPLDAGNIAPADLAAWLAALEAGLPAATLADPRTVVVAANHSGSFLPSLSAPGRIVVTSTSADGDAYQGAAEPGESRTASSFLNELAIGLAEGRSMASAFNGAGAALRRATRTGDENEQRSRARQQPRLDDNGDGEGSEVLADFGLDGQLAARSILGIGPPAIRLGVGEVTDTVTLASGRDSAELWARLGDGMPLGAPWVTIRAPSDRVDPTGSDLQGFLPFERLAFPAFNAARQRWELNYDGFDEPGLYEIAYQVLDAHDGSLSAATHSLVYRDAPGNQAPGAFALLAPIDGGFAATAPSFSWSAAQDPDGDPVTYTLEIAGEEAFSDPVVRQDRLTATAATVPAAAGLRDLSSYFWRVLAVDRWGAVRISETFQFNTDNSNGTPVLLQVSSKDASNGAALAAVDLTIDGRNAEGGPLTVFGQTNPQGTFGTQLGVGPVLLTPAKENYDAAPKDFQLSASGASVEVLLNPRASVDLTVALDYAPAWPRVGESIDYSVRITNRGPETATGIIVASDLAGTDFTVTAAPGCASTALPLVCDVPDLAPDASTILTISATPNLASGSARHVVNATANEADINPADNEGVILSVAVADADDDGDPDDTDPLPDTANARLSLRAGLNLRSLPVLPANVITAGDLLDALGADALRVERLDAAGGSWQSFDRAAGGSDFVLVPGEGYALTMRAAAEVELIGNPVSRSVNLNAGANLLGVLVETGGDAFGLMTRLGGDAVVAAVAGFDPHSGRYLTAGFDASGRPVGRNFPVRRGHAYYVMLRSPVPGFELR